MVAAWISADTGVGPAIASGSQVCSGNCADLPATPASSSSAIDRRVVQPAVGGGGEDAADPEGARVGGEREHADQEGDVAELGDQERLDRGRAGGLGLPVVADQEVRADAHDLPADQQHHQVAGVDDEQHRGGEQGDQGGVRGVARVVAQVGGRSRSARRWRRRPTRTATRTAKPSRCRARSIGTEPVAVEPVCGVGRPARCPAGRRRPRRARRRRRWAARRAGGRSRVRAGRAGGRRPRRGRAVAGTSDGKGGQWSRGGLCLLAVGGAVAGLRRAAGDASAGRRGR